MYTNQLDLQAISSERAELVARYERARAALRAVAGDAQPRRKRSVFAQVAAAVLHPLRLFRRTSRVGERSISGTSATR